MNLDSRIELIRLIFYYVGLQARKERLYMSEFIVDGKYQGYVYVGHAQGNFETKDGEKKPYYNIYVISPVSTYESEDYQARGYKAEKLKCISPDVWKDLDPGTCVRLFFDNKDRVVMAAIDQ